MRYEACQDPEPVLATVRLSGKFRAGSRLDTPVPHAPACGELGATAIETALVLPTFFLLLFGIFNFAIVLFGYCNATYASRAAARYASLHSSTSLAPSTTASVQSVVTPFVLATQAGATTVTTVWTPSNTVGSTVTVSVTIAYTLGIPFSTLRNVSVGSSMQRTITR